MVLKILDVKAHTKKRITNNLPSGFGGKKNYCLASFQRPFPTPFGNHKTVKQEKEQTRKNRWTTGKFNVDILLKIIDCKGGRQKANHVNSHKGHTGSPGKQLSERIQNFYYSDAKPT
jgi:hypothetical protein